MKVDSTQKYLREGFSNQALSSPSATWMYVLMQKLQIFTNRSRTYISRLPKVHPLVEHAENLIAFVRGGVLQAMELGK
jgi:hypothetical protein